MTPSVQEREREVARCLLDGARGASDLDAVLRQNQFAAQTYHRLAEITRLVELSHCRRFVMVGSGPFPAAVLFAVQHTRAADIVGLDADAASAQIGAAVVRAHGAGQARVRQGDGTQWDYSDADIVYVANQVSPKAGVVERIAATATGGTTVLLREPFGWGRLLAECALEHLPPRLSAGPAGDDNRHFLSKHHVLTVRTIR
jgi:hypothetical protein